MAEIIISKLDLIEDCRNEIRKHLKCGCCSIAKFTIAVGSQKMCRECLTALREPVYKYLPLARRISDFLFEYQLDWREKFVEAGAGRFIACSPDNHRDAPLHCEMLLLQRTGFPTDYIDRETIVVDTIGYEKNSVRDIAALLIALNIFVRVYFSGIDREDDLMEAVRRKFAELAIDFMRAFRVDWTKDNVDEDIANRDEANRLMSESELTQTIWVDQRRSGIDVNALRVHMLHLAGFIPAPDEDDSESGNESEEIEFFPPMPPMD